MIEPRLHALAGIGTIVVCALVAIPPLILAGRASAGPDVNLAEMESIEAELAMKSEDVPKQPQKETHVPDPVIDEAIGGNPNAKPDICKSDAECGPGKVCKKGTCERDKTAKPDPTIDPKNLPKHHTDDDTDPGATVVPKLGEFNGSEYGWAAETKGDPYYIDLVKDLREGWEYPTISSDEGVPVGCLHLDPSGKILDTLFKEKSGNPELDDSVDRAMTALKKKRNDDPIEVPTHLLQQGATTKWLCVRFKPKAA